MKQRCTLNPSGRASIPASPSLQLEYSLPSELVAISPFVDEFMAMITRCRFIPGGEDDIEIALREALNNAVIHGNREDRGKRVHVSCRCEPGQVSIAVRDEGLDFDISGIPEPTAAENIYSTHGRGIYLMKTLMDDVRFEQGGALVCMRKRADGRN